MKGSLNVYTTVYAVIKIPCHLDNLCEHIVVWFEYVTLNYCFAKKETVFMGTGDILRGH